MSEITEHMHAYLNELDHYMDRLNSGRLSRRDRRLFLEMSGEYYNIFHNAEVAEGEKPIFQSFLQEMVNFNDNIINQAADSKEQANQHYENMMKYGDSYINTVKITELMFGVFGIDAEIIRLQNEKQEMLQELVDRELNLHGEISQITQEILEVQHSKVSNGKVERIREWEEEPDKPTEKSEKENENMVSRFVDDINLTATFYNEKGEKQTVTLEAVYDDALAADPISRVIELVKEKKAAWKENEKCYIQEHNNDTGKTRRAGVYLVSSGRDVTPVAIEIPSVSNFKEVTSFLKTKGVKYNANNKSWYIERGALSTDLAVEIQQYLDSHKVSDRPQQQMAEKSGIPDDAIYLTLPSSSPQRFRQITEQIKSDGARFNPDKKAWYITGKEDRNKFADYLPAEKSSVHEKLNQYKESAHGAHGRDEDNRVLDSKRHESPELA